MFMGLAQGPCLKGVMMDYENNHLGLRKHDLPAMVHSKPGAGRGFPTLVLWQGTMGCF